MQSLHKNCMKFDFITCFIVVFVQTKWLLPSKQQIKMHIYPFFSPFNQQENSKKILTLKITVQLLSTLIIES